MTDVRPSLSEVPARVWIVAAIVVYGVVTLLGLGIIAGTAGVAALVDRLIGTRWLADLGLGVGGGLLVVVAGWPLSAMSSSYRRLEETFRQRLGPIPTGGVLVLAATSSIGEEVLFRGALQPLLGLVVTTVLFGVVHFPAERGLAAWPLFALVIGFGLGWLFESTGALVAPVAAHFTINFLNLLRMTRAGRGTIPAVSGDGA